MAWVFFGARSSISLQFVVNLWGCLPLFLPHPLVRFELFCVSLLLDTPVHLHQSSVSVAAFELKGAGCHQGYLLPIEPESVHVKLVELVLVCCNNIVVSTPVHGLSPQILLRLKSG